MDKKFTKFKIVSYIILILSFVLINFNQTTYAQWNRTSGIGGGFIWCITSSGSTLYAGTMGYGIFRSTDNGNSWIPSDSGLRNAYIHSLASSGSNIIAGTRNGIYYSSNNGISWNVGDTTLTKVKTVYALSKFGSGGTVYAGTSYHNITDPLTTFVSTNNGMTWAATPINPGFLGTNVSVYSMIEFNGALYAGTNHSVYKTIDAGFTWTQATGGDMGNDKLVYSLSPLGTKLIAGTYLNGVYWTGDNGVSYYAQNTGLPSAPNNTIYTLCTIGSTVFAASLGNSVYKALDGASLNWNNTACVGILDRTVYSLYSIGTSLFCGTYSAGVFVSYDSSSHWTFSSSGIAGVTLTCITNNGSTLFASTFGSGVFISTNNGDNWSITGKLTSSLVTALTPYSINIFAGTGTGVFLSTNNGANWTLSGLLGKNIISMATIGASIFAGESVSGTSGNVFLSSDGGQTWPGVFVAAKPVTCFTNLGTNIFMGENGDGVYLSINGGTAWNSSSSGLGNFNVHSLTAFATTNVFAGTDRGIYLSTNTGASWTIVSNVSNGMDSTFAVNALVNDGTNVIAGTNTGIYVSSNMGTSWLLRNEGLYSDTVINSLLIANSTVFSGVIPILPKSDLASSLVWKRSLSNLTIDVRKISSEVPDKFLLMQNYPNPFNPTTVIKWKIKDASFVTLKIFDITGRQIGSYVNEKLKAGEYETTINASGLSSGVYFYRLEAGNYTDTKKMILMK